MNRVAFERTMIDSGHVSDNFSLSIGRVNWQPKLALQSAKLDRALRASVEQLDQLLVKSIDLVSPVFYVQSDPRHLCRLKEINSLFAWGKRGNGNECDARITDERGDQKRASRPESRAFQPTRDRSRCF